METRKITIVNAKTNSKHVIDTDATTLAGLKSVLDNNHIDYEGLTFFESLSKSELTSNEAQLPKDVMYRGNPTNELVFLLMQKKKIESGGRKELYQQIAALKLKEACVKVYGKNFTNCSTAQLEELVNEATRVSKHTVKSEEAPAVVQKRGTEPNKPAVSKNDQKKDTECPYSDSELLNLILSSRC